MGAYKHLNNSVVNLTQAQEFSLKLAHLAQVRGLRSRKHSKPKGVSYCHSRLGESSLLRQELPVWASNSSLRL